MRGEPRAFAMHELAARAWYYLSPFPHERALAARRFRELVIASDDTRLQVVGELAIERYHARALTETIVRDRARLVDAFAPPDPDAAAFVRHTIADLMAKMTMRPLTDYAAAAAVAVAAARNERRRRNQQ